jgi:hypothetical protein
VTVPAVPMLAVEVPFGERAHPAYRPLAAAAERAAAVATVPAPHPRRA